MLEPYRVLDLCDERGLICGQMLADLGADVIQIEPPAGSSARRLAPFLGDEPDLERSLYWWAYARNKRSAVLDLETAEGQQRLRELVAGADFLIESDRPGSMARRGLDYEQLARVNPALIYVSITAYGQDGPKAGLAASDLTVLAAGGPLILYGDADRPPVRASVPQAFLHAGAEAAAAALIALHERTRSGRGQHVDVSAQQAVALATQADILQAAVGDEPLARAAGGARVGLPRHHPTRRPRAHVSVSPVAGEPAALGQCGLVGRHRQALRQRRSRVGRAHPGSGHARGRSGYRQLQKAHPGSHR